MARKARKAFFASQGSKCKHKHSPQGNELCGMGGEPPEPADEAKGEKPMLNAGSLAL